MLIISSLGDEVVQCPRNNTLWDERGKIFCNDIMQERNLVYHCLPTKSLNKFGEWCLKAKTIQKGLSMLTLTMGCSVVVVQLEMFYTFSMSRKHFHSSHIRSDLCRLRNNYHLIYHTSVCQALEISNYKTND